MKHLLVIGALLGVCACSAQPTYISPYSAPIALPLYQRVETREPERHVCKDRATLVCRPMLDIRMRGAARDCICVL